LCVLVCYFRHARLCTLLTSLAKGKDTIITHRVVQEKKKKEHFEVNGLCNHTCGASVRTEKRTTYTQSRTGGFVMRHKPVLLYVHSFHYSLIFVMLFVFVLTLDLFFFFAPCDQLYRCVVKVCFVTFVFLVFV
jgi:hypothetical protein